MGSTVTFIYLYPLSHNMALNLERDADEIAALALVITGIATVMAMVFASLIFGTTVDKEIMDSIGKVFIIFGAGYLFGKGRPHEK